MADLGMVGGADHTQIKIDFFNPGGGWTKSRVRHMRACCASAPKIVLRVLRQPSVGVVAPLRSASLDDVWLLIIGLLWRASRDPYASQPLRRSGSMQNAIE